MTDNLESKHRYIIFDSIFKANSHFCCQTRTHAHILEVSVRQKHSHLFKYSRIVMITLFLFLSLHACAALFCASFRVYKNENKVPIYTQIRQAFKCMCTNDTFWFKPNFEWDTYLNKYINTIISNITDFVGRLTCHKITTSHAPIWECANLWFTYTLLLPNFKWGIRRLYT